MVSVKAIVAVATLNFLTVAAVPAAKPPPDHAFRIDPSPEFSSLVYQCVDKNWRGMCKAILVEVDKCMNVEDGWDNIISSIADESRSNTQCIWYLDPDCKGQAYENPVDANLGDGNARFNDSISSYFCKMI